MASKFDYLRRNLYAMAELCLEQILVFGDAIEQENPDLAKQVIERDDLIDSLEKQNDNLSQNAILEAVANRNLLGMDQVDGEVVLKKDPLRFALSAIRINRNLERMGDQIVNCATCYRRGLLPKGFFRQEEILDKMLSRVVTLVGMAVESLVEEKNRFYGSVHTVEEELNNLCNGAFLKFVMDPRLDKNQFADLYRIILGIERAGDYAVNIAEELVRLNTGMDIRHLSDPVQVTEKVKTPS
ncbi:phosphate signaling complex PhoU family protein [Leptospira fainei]|nr:PhoU domain-containing protein [Leptospira fainei]